ncbi:MAG: hypothetical protein K8S16_21190 [Bacteroidales bacterium]|nr:hypothetical protein [Bacteroidales bacterium]
MLKNCYLFPVLFVFIFNHAIGQGIIIDHTCENLSQIPMSWIDSVQANQKWHYAHTSHGGQLTTGLARIETNDPAYNIARGYSTLPNVPGALCIFDGQEGDTYISPEEYWRTASGMNKTRDVLNNNPTINVSQWCWCCQVNSYSENDIQEYLDSISVLESEFPDVTFVYMTGNAQTGPGNHYNQNLTQGYNRHLRNEQIRNYCIANNKVLFDFADIDCWWYNPTSEEWEFSTYEYWNGSDTITVPFEHPQYNLNQAGHTSFENCENKGKAVWWMMAKLTGWDENIMVSLKVFLEGPFNDPEMNTNLTGLTDFPFSQPYNTSPWNYTGTENVTTIPNPDIVDWILVEMRDTTIANYATPESIIARQAAFLLKDGSIAGLDGISNLRFDITITHQLFTVVYHRNHLAIMSANPLSESSGVYTYDYSSGENQVYNGAAGHKDLGGLWGMYAGDGNSDGIVDDADKNIWSAEAGTFGYFTFDYELDAQVDNPDKNEAWLYNLGKESQVPD